MQTWDVPCIREPYFEDNDTDEESAEDEEEVKENTRMLDALSSFMDRRATMGDLRKGFVFFMVEERKEIKKLVAMSKARKLQMQD